MCRIKQGILLVDYELYRNLPNIMPIINFRASSATLMRLPRDPTHDSSSLAIFSGFYLNFNGFYCMTIFITCKTNEGSFSLQKLWNLLLHDVFAIQGCCVYLCEKEF